MPPNNPTNDVCCHDNGELISEIQPVRTRETNSQKQPAIKIKWINVLFYIILHISAIYGLYSVPFSHPLTWLWTIFTYVLGGWGITAGAHRLWSHRSYKAKLPLRIFLALCNSMAFQNDIITWARDHRVHHKYSETDADPHNALRGFFFAHCGWLMVKKHPEVKAKGQKLDLADLYSDPVCVYQRNMYYPSVVLLCVAMPTVVPMYFWGESFINAYFCAVLRYTAFLNATWCVNSVAHMFGNKPHDKHINPVENAFVAVAAVGEGFHNYHHTFPSDYSASELGGKLNLTTMFIDLMAQLGQVEDRKKMSDKVVAARKDRTGDGTVGFGYGQKYH
jgi:stearoyl-CoA desaturase (delta-9 desaturase)